jgi:pilus assembly protein Flp/PilA
MGCQATASEARSITMQSLFSRFVKDESGATAIEYGLIAAIIGVGIIVSLGGVKNALNTKFNDISTNLNTAS